MNTKLFALSIAAASLVLVGCDEKKNPTAAATDAMKNAAGKVSETTGKAVDATKDAASRAAEATKDGVNKAAEASKDMAAKANESIQSLIAGGKDGTVKYFSDALAGTKTQMEGWGKKIEALPAPAKTAVEPTFKDLKDKVAGFEKNLGDMKASAGDAWKATSEKLFGDWKGIGELSTKLQGMMK